MRCLVIYNPAAGKKGAYRGVREQIRCYCQKEGIDLEEAVTQFPGHAEKIAEAAARTGEPVMIISEPLALKSAFCRWRRR